MPIDFYIIQSQSSHQWMQLRDFFVCQLVEKVWKAGHRIYLHSDTAAQARQLDALLWTFRKLSFIPHALFDGKNPSPISLGYTGLDLNQDALAHDVLINLALEIPSFFVNFKRVLEVVSDDAQIKQAGRLRYRFYQQQQHNLTTHIIQR